MIELINYLNSIRIKLRKINLPLHEPDINIEDEKEVIKGLKSGYVSSIGKDIPKFEKKLSNITKSKFVLSTINGTSALHIGLKVIGVKSQDEVLVPSLSFVAPVNAILYNNATPHFIDSEINHFGIDPKKLNINAEKFENLIGDDAKFNANKMINIFKGEDNDFSKAVCLNAAAGLIVNETHQSYADAYINAREYILSGQTFNHLESIQNA